MTIEKKVILRVLDKAEQQGWNVVELIDALRDEIEEVIN